MTNERRVFIPIASALADLRAFPEDVQDLMGQALLDAQYGDTHPDAKPLKGFGGKTVYGLIERAEIVRAENLLPLTMTNGIRLTRAVAADQPITYDMIERPNDSFLWSLRAEQDEVFAGAKA